MLIWAWQKKTRRFCACAHYRTSLEISPHSNEQQYAEQQHCRFIHETMYCYFKTDEECPLRWEGGRCDGFVLFFLLLLRWHESSQPRLVLIRKGGRCPPSSGHHHSPQHRHRITGLCVVVSMKLITEALNWHEFKTLRGRMCICECVGLDPGSAKLQRYVSPV